MGVENGADVAEGGVVVVADDAEGEVAGGEGIVEFGPGVVGIEGVGDAVVEGGGVGEVDAEVRFFVGAGAHGEDRGGE